MQVNQLLILHSQILSQKSQYTGFLFQLADLGCTLEHAQLRDAARHVLQLIPPDTLTVTRLQWFFGRFKENEAPQISSIDETNTSVGTLFFTASPSQVLYNLEVRARLKSKTNEKLERLCDIFRFICI